MLLSKQKYIVNCEKEVDPPAYLRNRYRGRVTFDLTPIMKKQTGNSTSRYEKKLLRASNLQDAITHARYLWKSIRSRFRLEWLECIERNLMTRVLTTGAGLPHVGMSEEWRHFYGHFAIGDFVNDKGFNASHSEHTGLVYLPPEKGQEFCCVNRYRDGIKGPSKLQEYHVACP